MKDLTIQTTFPDRLSLPPLVFSQLNHALKLAYVQSYENGLDGQHLRTAIGQLLYHLEKDGSTILTPLRSYCREVSLARVSEVLR